MESLLPYIVNIVYGLLFFSAFAVLIATVVLFALATWDKAIKPLILGPTDTPSDAAPE